jgi:elongation factor P
VKRNPISGFEAEWSGLTERGWAAIIKVSMARNACAGQDLQSLAGQLNCPPFVRNNPQVCENSANGRKDSGKKDLGAQMLKSTQLRPGMIIMHEGDLHVIYSVDHRTPGNKRGSMQTKMRNLRSGSMMDYRFRAEEFVEKVTVDEIEFEYLYSDGDGHHFMNSQNYEQLALQNDIVGDTKDYLIPNLPVKIEYYDDKPIGVLLPDTVDLTVVDTEQTIQKATASAVMKPAKLETGLVINVPPFVGNGDKVKVDTSEARYIQRIQ